MATSVAEFVQSPGFPFRLGVERTVLHFRKPARTSRGSLVERPVWRVYAYNSEGSGMGDCCTIPGLSPENIGEYEKLLCGACEWVTNQGGLFPWDLASSPSVRFGIECALLAAQHPTSPRWDTPFARGEKGIRIHHLIWMDDIDVMLSCMAKGIAMGFNCLKLKVGSLPFAHEVAMLKEAHAAFPHAEIRVDANGAFSPEEAPLLLDQLKAAGVTLIEQPIKPRQYETLANLCHSASLPIALDEELIAIHTPAERERLLDHICPQAIVIKPSLHGGLSGAENWAELAEQRGIRWWINSALESHVGLTALAEWCALRAPDTMHGLGTGCLFLDDNPYPIHLEGNHLFYRL